MGLLAAAIMLARAQSDGHHDLSRVEDLALRALAADGSLGENFLTIATLRQIQGDLRATLRAADEALAREPTLAGAHEIIGGQGCHRRDRPCRCSHRQA